jgi:beta-glucosidase
MPVSLTAMAVVAFLLVAFFLLSSPATADVKYKDPKQPVNERVEDLLSRMTLEEKIGQMSQIERANATPAVIQKYFVGSVLSGGGSVPAEKASASAWQKVITQMQKAALRTRLGIPIIYGIDAVHGNNNVYNATIFPHNVGLGATRDPTLVKRIGEATAHEARATGIPYTFAPCVAVCPSSIRSVSKPNFMLFFRHTPPARPCLLATGPPCPPQLYAF